MEFLVVFVVGTLLVVVPSREFERFRLLFFVLLLSRFDFFLVIDDPRIIEKKCY